MTTLNPNDSKCIYEQRKYTSKQKCFAFFFARIFTSKTGGVFIVQDVGFVVIIFVFNPNRLDSLCKQLTDFI